mgnify:CR=1 FL=1
MAKKYDFSGWATKANLLCTDGRVIDEQAFKECDGKRVPLVWNHEHSSVENVLGHADLEYRPNEGIYARCKFNNSVNGMDAKEAVLNGDIGSMSIFANHLQQNGKVVIHGSIKEVSLVLAGANPGAVIDNVISHTDEDGLDHPDIGQAWISSGPDNILLHAEDQNDEKEGEDAMATETKKDEKQGSENEEPKAEGEKTIQDVIDSMTDEQKAVMYGLIGQAIEETKNENNEENDEEDKDMKQNAFDKSAEMTGRDANENTISHADEAAIFADVKRYGSLKESALQHGVTNINYLFPEASMLPETPGFVTDNEEWVKDVMNAVHRTPFARVKSIFGDLTDDDARALGFTKGKQKKDEVFALLKRETAPTTVYKKQKLNRDDVVDITDFDVVAWIKGEMRGRLDVEIARAILITDGRSASSDDKISETSVRSVWKDDDLYTVKVAITEGTSDTDETKAKNFIRAIKKNRREYQGSGNPTLYTTEDMLSEMLLIEDTTGRAIYADDAALAKALRVAKIVAVPPMAGQTRVDGNDTYTLGGLIVNLKDYNIGADKGGAVNMFDDFDIDYNAMKYLIETRISGALIRPHAALAVEFKKTTVAPGP